MKSTNRMWLKAAAATVGVGALTFGAVLPATAAEGPQDLASPTDGDKYQVAAARTDSSVKDLKQAEQAGLAHVSDDGFVMHIDPAVEFNDGSAFAARDSAPQSAAIPGSPAAGSRPGAPVTIYLDFDGETLTGTRWNKTIGQDPQAFEPAAGADAAFQAEVWAAVAEDYAPFNVNVTTTNPGADKLYKTSDGDNEYGSHVIITDSYDEVYWDFAGSGGIAWGPALGSQWLTGAFVFTDGTGNIAKNVADAASHEAGHNFGLDHDGIAGQPGDYYSPSDGVWGTIMGAPYEVPVTQWSAGAYAGSTNQQDDLAVITDRSAAERFFMGAYYSNGQPYPDGPVCVISGDPQNPQPGDQFQAVVNDECGEILTLRFDYNDRGDFAADQVGNDAASATLLDNPAGTFAGAGVIERTSDVDVFSVITGGGTFSAEVEVADVFANLDAKLTLTDANGAVKAESNPDAGVNAGGVFGLGASITADDLPVGVYYLTVDGVGFGDPSTATPANANGYTEYGSLGNYSIKGSAPELKIEPVVIETPADGAEVKGGSDVEVTGTATPEATITVTVGDNAVTTTADAEGKWSTTVKVNQYGNTAIVASQKVGPISVPTTDTATVTAPVPAPVITSPTDGATVETGTPTITGTGIPGALVEVGIGTGNSGGAVGTTTVAADGTWSFTLTTALVNGAYSVGATQSINGVVSDGAEFVDFIVKITVPPTTPPTTPPTKPNGNGNNLATTGGDFDAVPFTLLAAGVLMAAGATAFFGFRQRRKVSAES